MANNAWQDFSSERLPDGRSWSATFDSYDQYRDLVYYLATVDGATFMVMSDLGWAATIKDWEGPEFTAELRKRIADVAATGQTNTSYSR